MTIKNKEHLHRQQVTRSLRKTIRNQFKRFVVHQGSTDRYDSIASMQKGHARFSPRPSVAPRGPLKKNNSNKEQHPRRLKQRSDEELAELRKRGILGRVRKKTERRFEQRIEAEKKEKTPLMWNVNFFNSLLILYFLSNFINQKIYCYNKIKF